MVPPLRSLPTCLQVAAQLLVPLDRLEECLEVAVPEAARPVALDDLEEQRRAVAEGLREDLQEIALVVAVGQDAELPQVVGHVVHAGHALPPVLLARPR